MIGSVILIALVGALSPAMAADGKTNAVAVVVRTPLQNIQTLIVQNKASLATAEAELRRRQIASRRPGYAPTGQQIMALRRVAVVQARLVDQIKQQIARLESTAARLRAAK